MAEIRVERLHKAFQEFVAVVDSNITVADGTFFVMLGPSGCGKTTTLRMIAGLEMPTDGRILLGGEDVTFRRASERDIAFVFQLFALYPHMDVAGNIGFPLRCQGVRRRETQRRVHDTAQLLRIEHLLERKVSQLSAGDRQRVALGRAIVRRPQAFLMDEPLGALDTEFRHLMCGELRELHDRIKATTIYVTHDQLEAMAMADRIAVMNHGVVEQIDTPQRIYDRPRTLYVAGFIGNPPMNLLRFNGSLAPGQSCIRLGEVEVEVPEVRQGVEQSELVLGVRPEHVTISDDGGLRGEVFGVEYMGTMQFVTVNTEYGRVKARIPSRQRVAISDRVGLSFASERLTLFEAKSGRAVKSALFMEAGHG